MALVDTRNFTKSRRFIARCSHKGCRAATSALVRTEGVFRVYEAPTTGRCSIEREIIAAEVIDGGTRWTVTVDRGRLEVAATLPCGHGAEVHEVAGTYNPDKGCDARCHNAVGAQCDCSCGGLNHGRSHGHH